MEPEDIIRHYPRLYHMAEAGSWPNIQRHGLLSTSALLDMYEIDAKERPTIESQQRRESVTIHHQVYGTAVIRDQKPLNESALQKLIVGMSPKEYYELLNRMTFFWARRIRLERLLNARAYRGKSHTVLTIDTRSLINKHHKNIWLSNINSGAIFGSGRRGTGTFKRISEYPFEEIKKKKKDDAIVEVAVDYAVKDISKHTIMVEEWFEKNPIRTIWEVEHI